MHLACQICGKKREVDQVLNDNSVVEAKKFVADGGSVTCKLHAEDAFKPNGDPSQRGESLIDRRFKLVGV